MAVTRFWLIRHGEPVEEARQRCYGSSDVKLSARGREQMTRVAEYLANEPIAAIYTSPLDRTIESSRILGLGPIHIVHGLREIAFGDFEGLTYDEIAVAFPQAFQQWMERPTEVRFPNGESYTALRDRVLAAFEAIGRESEGRTVAIVSHGGVNRILIAWALGMPADCIFRLAQDYAAINLLSFSNDIPRVELLNYCAAKPPAPQRTVPSPE